MRELAETSSNKTQYLQVPSLQWSITTTICLSLHLALTRRVLRLPITKLLNQPPNYHKWVSKYHRHQRSSSETGCSTFQITHSATLKMTMMKWNPGSPHKVKTFLQSTIHPSRCATLKETTSGPTTSARLTVVARYLPRSATWSVTCWST